jgi:hypothetical protein
MKSGSKAPRYPKWARELRTLIERGIRFDAKAARARSFRAGLGKDSVYAILAAMRGPDVGYRTKARSTARIRGLVFPGICHDTGAEVSLNGDIPEIPTPRESTNVHFRKHIERAVECMKVLGYLK